METVIRFDAAALRFVVPHLSTDKHREALQCVCVEPTGLAVATDGHTLGFHKRAAQPFDAPEAVLLRFEKPSALIASKVAQVAVALNLAAPLGSPVRAEMLDSRGVAVGFAVCTRPDAAFPTQWRTVYKPSPGAVGVPHIGFDAALAGRFSVKVKGDAEVVVARFDSALSAILIQYPAEPDAGGLLMPSRVREHGTTADRLKKPLAEAWADLTTPEEAAPEAEPMRTDDGEFRVERVG